jgi:RNA polymerase sigma-70 factor (ECF subfamily)
MLVRLPGQRVSVDAEQESVRTERDVRVAYSRYGGELLGFALNALDDRQLAEEVVQETFVRAWRSGSEFDVSRGSLRTWLYAIARNGIVDALRRRKVRERHRPVDHIDLPAPDRFDQLLTSIQVDEALNRLTAEHRHVVVGVHFHGRTCAELADQLGIPASTTRSRLYYGVRALRLILEENGGLAR